MPNFKIKTFNSNREVIDNPTMFYSAQVKDPKPYSKIHVGIPKQIQRDMNIQRNNEHEFRVIILRKKILKKPKGL